MTEEKSYISVTVPIRLAGSHGTSRRGFESVRKGSLSTKAVNPPPRSAPFVQSFSATAITVLGFAIASLAVSKPSEGWQKLKVTSVKKQTALAIGSFVLRLADALAASFAPRSACGPAEPGHDTGIRGATA
jgi:hypothetical protein